MEAHVSQGVFWGPLGSMVRDLRAHKGRESLARVTGLKTFASGKNVPWSQ